MKWNNSVYFRLSKMLCGFKDQVRARTSGEQCGLSQGSVPFAGPLQITQIPEQNNEQAAL